MPGDQIRTLRPNWVCTGPVTYQGAAALQREIAMLAGTRRARGCLSHHDLAGEPRALPAERLLQGVMPQNLIWFWKWSDMKELP
jgi:hypothetical protein